MSTAAKPMKKKSHRRVLLVLGVEMRSGTNYIYDLLEKHPDCVAARSTPEDFMVAESAYLGKYINTLWSFWKKYTYSKMTIDSLQEQAENFIHSILIDQVAQDQSESLVVSKTPCVGGLNQLPLLFKNTKVLFLVRDGRSVAYSLQRSFDCGFFKAMWRWQQGARAIIKFKQAYPDYYADNCLLVRYEDLFKSPKSELHRCFEFLELDPNNYDYEYAYKSHIIGSSEIRGSERSVHWKPLPRNDSFSPLERYKEWSRQKQVVSGSVLRKELESFGYSVDRPQYLAIDSFAQELAYDLFCALENASLMKAKKILKKKLLS
jgi:hypothetical protein